MKIRKTHPLRFLASSDPADAAAAGVSVRPAYAAKTAAELEEEQRKAARSPHWNRRRRSSRKS